MIQSLSFNLGNIFPRYTGIYAEIKVARKSTRATNIERRFLSGSAPLMRDAILFPL